MRTKELTISKDFSMLPDAVAELVQTACKGVMSLVAIKSKELVIEIDGADEDDAIACLAGFWS